MRWFDDRLICIMWIPILRQAVYILKRGPRYFLRPIGQHKAQPNHVHIFWYMIYGVMVGESSVTTRHEIELCMPSYRPHITNTLSWDIIGGPNHAKDTKIFNFASTPEVIFKQSQFNYAQKSLYITHPHYCHFNIVFMGILPIWAISCLKSLPSLINLWHVICVLPDFFFGHMK